MENTKVVAVSSLASHALVIANGILLADSFNVLLVEEPGHGPRYYFPRGDVRMDLLTSSATKSTCPYKGEASYWSLGDSDGGDDGGHSDSGYRDFVWSYEKPIDSVAAIAGCMCFYNDRVALSLDGERSE